MTALKYLEGFPPPADDTVIWRYTPAHWFVQQIKNGVLTFSRLDRFENDEHEGWLPTEIVVAFLDRVEAELGSTERDIYSYTLTNGKGRRAHGASCWFIQPNETAMMWERYGHGGIAMRSTVGALVDALTEPDAHRLIFGEIHYGRWPTKADYSNTSFCFWKDPRYRDESEFRALIHKPSSYGIVEIDEYTDAQFGFQNAIHEIKVCPTYCEKSGDPFADIADAIRSAGLTIPLTKSTVGQKPDYSTIRVPPEYSCKRIGSRGDS